MRRPLVLPNQNPAPAGRLGAISRVGCAALASALATMVLLHPAIAAGATQPMVDSMVVQYEANGGRAFEQPLGVAVNVHDDEIVVANTGLGRVEFFGRDGRPHGYFVHRVADSAGVLRDGLPKHVAATADGRVLVSDSWAAYIDVCDFRGRSLQRLALCAPDDRIDTGNGPGPIAIAPDGRILVASRGKAGRVHVFSPEGTQLSSWGTAGSEPGQLASITAIGVAPNGEIVVTCASTTLAVQVFDASGRYLRGFGVHDLGAGNFSLPNALVITPDSRLWVCDGIRHQVQVFDMAGMLLGVVGGGGEGPGALLYPSALASDGQGFFALVETGGRRLRFWWIR